MNRKIQLTVNGDRREIFVKPWQTLLDVLRDEFKFARTKEGCGEGECGACTVLIDGRPINACMTLAVLANGRKITTVGGLAGPGELHPLQESFIEHGAVQCGYCSPGVILSAKALLDENPHPSEAEVRRAISGNLCRCTGYEQIVEAILSVADQDVSETPR